MTDAPYPAGATVEYPAGATVEDSGRGGLQVLVTAGPARFLADEPVELGGMDLGPTPHDLVCAGLGVCTTQTLRLYAQRKGWPLGAVKVQVTHRRDINARPVDIFDRVLILGGALDEEQRQRLLEIAEKCPVHLMLTHGASVVTSLS